MITCKEFLKLLFPSLDGFIEIRAIHMKTGSAKSYFYSSVDHFVSNQADIDLLSKEHNVYFGVCPRQEKRGDKKSVKFVWALWSDLDPKFFKSGKKDILRSLNSFPISPTIVVDSGNGIHPYWRLKEPIEISNEKDVLKVEAYLRALAKALDGDTSAAELARILRLPGTINHKNHEDLKTVTILELNGKNQCNLIDFDSFLSIETTKDTQRLNPPGWISDDLLNLQKGNRNSTFAKLTGRLHREHWTSDEIYTFLEPHAKMVSFNLEELRTEIDGICKRYSNNTVPSSLIIENNSHISLNSQLVIDEDAYYGLAGDVVRIIGPHTEADYVAVLVQFLATFGCIIGRKPHWRVENDRHSLILSPVLIGKTSKGRKGISWGRVKNLFKRVSPDWIIDSVKSGLSSGEGLIWAVRDPIPDTKDLGVSDKRLLIIESEFASVLKQVSRQGNILSPTVRQSWDSGDLRTLTKISPAQSTGAHISILGHITKDELTRYLNTTEIANGFGNRFLWLCVQRSKELPFGGSLQESDLNYIVKRLKDAIEFAKEVDEIELSEDAKKIWAEVYSKLSAEKPGLVGALIGRTEAYVRRIACLYTLLDCSSLTQPEHLKAAIAISEYSGASVENVFGDALGDPTADSIYAALKENQNGLNRTDINNLFKRHKTSSEIERALEVLLEYNKAYTKTFITNGRSIEQWYAK